MLCPRLKAGGGANTFFQQPVLPYATFPYLSQPRILNDDSCSTETNSCFTESNSCISSESCNHLLSNDSEIPCQTITITPRPHIS